MNCNDGSIYPPDVMESLKKLWDKPDSKVKQPLPDPLPKKEEVIEMRVEPTEKQMNRKPPKLGEMSFAMWKWLEV